MRLRRRCGTGFAALCFTVYLPPPRQPFGRITSWLYPHLTRARSPGPCQATWSARRGNASTRGCGLSGLPASVAVPVSGFRVGCLTVSPAITPDPLARTCLAGAPEKEMRNENCLRLAPITATQADRNRRPIIFPNGNSRLKTRRPKWKNNLSCCRSRRCLHP